MPVWWVTGATGFLGRHVLFELARRNYERSAQAGGEADRLVGITRNSSDPAGFPDPVEFLRLEIDSEDAIRRAQERASPDYVIHCAGRTPPASEDELRRSNLDATAKLLAGLRRLERPIRVVIAGSAAELGPVPSEDLPVGEDYPCRPLEPYGRIKWEASQLALAETSPIETIVARIFNPIGPGLSESQAFGRFASRLLDPGPDPLTLRVGGLESRRDFVDIRDVARAMIALALKGTPAGVYHVGTGQSRRVGDGLNLLIGLSGRAVRLEIDPDLGNARGPSDSRADIRRITEETGWKPRVSWERSLSDLWRAAKNEAARRRESA